MSCLISGALCTQCSSSYLWLVVSAPPLSMTRQVPTACTAGSWEVPGQGSQERSSVIHHARAGFPNPGPSTWKPAPGRGLNLCRNHRVSTRPGIKPAAREAEIKAPTSKAETRVKPVFRGGGSIQSLLPGGAARAVPQQVCTRGSVLCCCSLAIVNTF